MKPFDLEAAKQGAVFYRYGDPTIPLTLVGVKRNGMVAWEDHPSSPITVYGLEAPRDLRMLPRKIVKYGLIHEHRKGSYISTSLTDAPDMQGHVLVPGYHVARVEWEE